MIVKTHFTPARMWPYCRFELLLGAVASVVAWGLVGEGSVHQLGLPVTTVVVLGTALSILLAVRINTSYQRWWEVSGAWAQIVAHSRTLVRVVVAVSNSKVGPDPESVSAFQADIAGTQIAYVNALRIQLRGLEDWSSVTSRLPSGTRDELAENHNVALQLLGRQSRRIFEAYGAGILSGLDNINMETALGGLSQQQALVERTASQPTPRTYDVFSRYFVHLYVVVFPFALVGSMARDLWLAIPATLIVAFAFRMLERIGTVVESPFANTISDLPLGSICTETERDLLSQIGATDLPEQSEPINGYLW